MPRAILRTSLLLILSALSSFTVAAQTNVTNPKVVEFDPSLDHSALTADGQPMVARYDLQVFLLGATQPITTTSLGKPAADPADGKIRVDFSTLVVGWPLGNGTYEARVAAVGPTGSGQSAPSNPFDLLSGVPPPPSCTFTLSPSSASPAGTAGAFTAALAASATSCTWTATKTADWIALGTTAGAGSASVAYTLSRNNSGATRMGTITVGGRDLTLTQASMPRPSPPKGIKLTTK